MPIGHRYRDRDPPRRPGSLPERRRARAGPSRLPLRHGPLLPGAFVPFSPREPGRILGPGRMAAPEDDLLPSGQKSPRSAGSGPPPGLRDHERAGGRLHPRRQVSGPMGELPPSGDALPARHLRFEPGAGQGESAILYPTTAPEAEEAWIEVSDPVGGGGRARVVLRPGDLYKLANLTSDGRSQALREREAYARRLAFDERQYLQARGPEKDSTP